MHCFTEILWEQAEWDDWAQPWFCFVILAAFSQGIHPMGRSKTLKYATCCHLFFWPTNLNKTVLTQLIVTTGTYDSVVDDICKYIYILTIYLYLISIYIIYMFFSNHIPIISPLTFPVLWGEGPINGRHSAEPKAATGNRELDIEYTYIYYKFTHT